MSEFMTQTQYSVSRINRLQAGEEWRRSVRTAWATFQQFPVGVNDAQTIMLVVFLPLPYTVNSSGAISELMALNRRVICDKGV